MSEQIPLRCINPYVRHICRVEMHSSKPEGYFKAYDRVMLCICEGNGFLQIRASYVPLRPGTFVLINAGEPCNVIAYVGERLSGYKLHFDYTQDHSDVQHYLAPVRTQQFNKKLILNDPLPLEFPEVSRYLCVHSMQQIEGRIRNMLEMYEGQQRFSDCMLSGLTKAILCELFANYSMQRVLPISPGEGLVWNVLSYMNSHYMENLTNQSIASQLNYHPNYLNRQMVLFTGRSMHQHLTACRLSKAMELLLFTSVPIADIAEKTGFRSASRFSKVFQQNVGCSPSKMRAMYSDASEYGSKMTEAEDPK